MWIKRYNPSLSDWYLIKIDGKKTMAMWNDVNKFWSIITGKTYKPDQIDSWLDDTNCLTQE